MSSKTKQADKGLLAVLSAPSGCGKTTIVDRLLKRHSDWTRSISMTTRAPRSGEKDGQDYFFVSEKAFKEMEARGEFLEFAKIYDRYYGTPKKQILKAIEQGQCVILAIDVQGAESIKSLMPEKDTWVSVFVLPPSMKVLRERLEGRKTDTPEEIERRIELAQDEIKAASLYDFSVMNQDLEQTVMEIENLIHKYLKERREKNRGIHSA